MLQREMRFKAYAVILTVGVVITSVTSVLLAWQGFSYRSSAAAGVISATVGAIAFNLAAPHHFSVRLHFRGWRDVARFGLDIMTIGGISVLGLRLGEIILGRIFGIAALGVYSRASAIYYMIFDNLYGSATRVVFAKLSRNARDSGTLRQPFLQAFAMILAVMWPIQLGLAILSAPAISLLYGPQWIDAAAPLALLMIAQMVVLTFGMNWELFVIRGETRTQSRIEFRRVLVGLAAFTAGSFLGLAGAAAGRIVEALFGNLLYRRHVDRLAALQPGDVPRILRRSLMLALLAVAPSAVLMICYGGSPQTPVLAISAAVLLGIACWMVGLIVLRHPLYQEMSHILRHGQPRDTQSIG